MWSRQSMAATTSSFCRWLHRWMSLSSLLVLAVGSFEMTPVPEQGASSSTRSNPVITCSKVLASFKRFNNHFKFEGRP